MLNAELFKLNDDRLQLELEKLIKQIWLQEVIPSDCNTAVIVALHKKGEKACCNNYRGLSLLSAIYKIIARIIYQRLSPYVEDILGAGFRPNRSTNDHIFTLKQILEKRWEYAQDCHMLFIDFKQAYDSIHRETLWKIMTEFQIPTKLTKMVKALYTNTASHVRVNGALGEAFPVLSGVRQGCLLSPCLFNLALEWVFRHYQAAGVGVRIGRLEVAALAYADDVVLLADDMASLEEAFTSFMSTAERVGLKVNSTKTKVMHIERGAVHLPGYERISDMNIERVNKFTYLGSTLSPNNDINQEVEVRISAATRAFYGLKELFTSRILSRKTKSQLYSTMVRPVLMYGAESWSPTQLIETKLLRFENNTLKTICGPIFDAELNRWRRRYAREVRDLTSLPRVTDVVRSARIRWLGHILRQDQDRLPLKVFSERMVGRRPRGRPRTRWRDVVVNDLRLLGVDPANMDVLAQDRREWRRLVVAAKGLNRPIAPDE